ncbi:MAG: sodium:calcium antiporter [Gammaproteobacteria bacterium]|nr:MAG: sodium:calcium antiporter [Gammaproteobacteria bacterium]
MLHNYLICSINFNNTKFMITSLILLSIGIYLLILGSDFFVEGSTSIAKILKIPMIVIGLTIVAFATSAPEILVSIVAAMSNESNLAVGNAIGSNTANIALVLGSMAIVKAVPMDSLVLKKLIKNLLIITILMIIPFLDSLISQSEGFIILIGFSMIMLWLLRFSLELSKDNHTTKNYVDQESLDSSAHHSFANSVFCLIFGLFLLFYGADMVVNNAIEIATILNISETVIGITIVAIGTSLPELSVSITSAIKGQHGLAVGNIIGSNIFNLLAVIGVASSISPAILPENTLTVHFFLMLMLTIIVSAITFRNNKQIKRIEGFLLLLIFLSYIGYIIYNN